MLPMDIKALINRLQPFFNDREILKTANLESAIQQIEKDFISLPRNKYSCIELVDLKFKMQHWRKKIVSLVSSSLDENPSTNELLNILAILTATSIRPDTTFSQKLFGVVLKQKASPKVTNAAALYFANINEHQFLKTISPNVAGDILRIAGPSRELSLIANAPSKFTFDKWSQDEEFTKYRFISINGKSGVRYRGVDLLPGDVLLCNVNRNGNGVYTFLCEPRSYAYHLGVFAIIDHETGPLPAIIEAYKLGVRAIPLSSFFTPKFNSYVEICRLKNQPTDFGTKINAYAAIIENEVRGYNFDTEDPDRRYLACTTVASLMFEKAGVAPISTKSGYTQNQKVQRSLRNVDFVLPAFLSLSDFLVDERMEVVGVIDNGHFDLSLARELCERHFVKSLQRMEMSVSKLPPMVAISRFAIRAIRSGSLLGRIIGFFAGFTPSNLPKGPEKVLAVIEFYEHQLKAAVKSFAPVLLTLWKQDELINVQVLVEDSRINSSLDEHFVEIFKTCE